MGRLFHVRHAMVAESVLSVEEVVFVSVVREGGKYSKFLGEPE